MTTLPIANPVQPLIDVFDSVLVFFHDTVGLSWGFSIIALTIVVRTALIPLTLKQFRSMQALQRLSPEIKALQAKYKDDRQRLNQEMMKFYQENKVNPFGSCLPLVMQLPVFFSLFYMLRKDLKIDICGPEEHILKVAAEHGKTLTTIGCDQVDPGSAGFLFINDLTAKATGATLIVLIVLYVGSQLASTLLMSTTTDKTQRMIFLALPFVFVTFVIQFPAGLLVYWITTNLWTIVQQAIIRKRLGPLRPVGADTGSPLSGLFGGGGGSSGSNGPKSADGGAEKAATRVKQPAKVGGAEPKGRPSGPPPASPRKKKKRSGRRR